MPETPGDAQVNSVVNDAQTDPASASPREPAGDKGQPTIKIGDKTFMATDIEGILNAKAGLEREKAEMKKKLDEYETAKLSEREKLEKEKADLAAENATLKKSVITSKIQAALDAKGVRIKADVLNLQVSDESQIEAAVQNLIKENPALAMKAAPGSGTVPPGTAPPAGAPPSADAEADIRRKFENARTPEEFAQAEKEYANLRGSHNREEKKPI